jgi:hypothetical protein
MVPKHYSRKLHCLKIDVILKNWIEEISWPKKEGEEDMNMPTIRYAKAFFDPKKKEEIKDTKMLMEQHSCT